MVSPENARDHGAAAGACRLRRRVPRPCRDHADAARGPGRDDRGARPARQPLLAAQSGPPGPPGGRGVARADRRRLRRPAQRGRLHQRRHRGGQPGRQGPVLGPPPGLAAAAPGGVAAGSSTTPCWTRPAGWRSTRAPRWTGCRSDAAGMVSAATAAGGHRGRPGQRRHDQRDVGEQRGRHRPARRRAGRGRPRVPGSRSTATRCRPRASCRSAWPAAAPPR